MTRTALVLTALFHAAALRAAVITVRVTVLLGGPGAFANTLPAGAVTSANAAPSSGATTATLNVVIAAVPALSVSMLLGLAVALLSLAMLRAGR